MKLNIVPASRGTQWVKLGIQTFLRQPLALSGLFFMFMAAVAGASAVPVVGTALALALIPAASLGLMAATREATRGRFPMPSILVSAFRAGRERMRAMLVLGGLYAAGFLLIMAVSSLVDGGKFARLYLLGGQITQELVMSDGFQGAMWLSMALYLPLSLMFWHAPALVHWYGVPPVKSMFFSIVACLRNTGALTVYGLVWSVLIFGVILLVTLLFGRTPAGQLALIPVGLVLVCMFFVSVYFTFRDSFEFPPDESTTESPT